MWEHIPALSLPQLSLVQVCPLAGNLGYELFLYLKQQGILVQTSCITSQQAEQQQQLKNGDMIKTNKSILKHVKQP